MIQNEARTGRRKESRKEIYTFLLGVLILGSLGWIVKETSGLRDLVDAASQAEVALNERVGGMEQALSPYMSDDAGDPVPGTVIPSTLVP